VRSPAALGELARRLAPHTLIHLAAKREVVTPWDRLGELVETNVVGTFNVLEALRPRRILLASSSTVYGNCGRRGARPNWSSVGPIGEYGMSKAAAELICRDWAREKRGVAFLLRIGNVVGPGCPGLIEYLVRHARRFPDGSAPAELRGGGGLIRDYVPIGYVVEAMVAAVGLEQEAGAAVALNLSSGRGLTNREVAELVGAVLEEQGYRLRFRWDNPRAPGEVTTTILDPSATERSLGVPAPDREGVVEAIRAAALAALAAG
jgi:UDP-glucuronate 4-epimerase